MADNIVQYGSYEVDEAVKEQESWDAGLGEFGKITVGKNTLRVLPPSPGRKSPFRVVFTHYINFDKDKSVSFACPRLEAKKPCPVCIKADQLQASGNPADYERAKEFFPSRRVYMNAVNRTHESVGPQVYGIGKTIHEALIALRKDEDAGGDFTHPENGFDVIIERKGKGKNDTEYKVFPSRHTTKLGNLEWIAVQKNLDVYGRIMTPDEIRDFVRKAKEAASGHGSSEPRRQVKDTNSSPAPKEEKKQTVEQDIEDAQVVDGGQTDAPF